MVRAKAFKYVDLVKRRAACWMTLNCANMQLVRSPLFLSVMLAKLRLW